MGRPYALYRICGRTLSVLPPRLEWSSALALLLLSRRRRPPIHDRDRVRRAVILSVSSLLAGLKAPHCTIFAV
ncbi:hypothetical protein VPH35_096465 [Triticum aestivum]